MKFLNIFILSVFFLFMQGCISTGQKLDYDKVSTIKKKVTTEADIRAMFGEPVTLETNMKRGVRILTYGYRNSDAIKQGAATLAGGAAGATLGSKIGGGLGASLMTGVGGLVGGFVMNNLVKSRNEEQYLEVVIGLKSKKVIDFNFIETKGRSQSIGVNSGVNSL